MTVRPLTKAVAETLLRAGEELCLYSEVRAALAEVPGRFDAYDAAIKRDIASANHRWAPPESMPPAVPTVAQLFSDELVADYRAGRLDEPEEFQPIRGRSVTCTYCHAAPGDYCISPKGYKRPSHMERIAAWRAKSSVLWTYAHGHEQELRLFERD